MRIDWQGRIDDLCRHLAAGYQIEDQAAIEILLSALLPCPRTPALWLVLETEWLRAECGWAWFNLGQGWATSLSHLRTMRPRYLDALLREYAAEPRPPRLLIEPDFEHLPVYRRRSQATRSHLNSCLAQCLRVRTLMPRGTRVVLDSEEFQRRSDILRALTRHILDDPTQDRPPDPPRFVPPPDFRQSLELVRKLAPWYGYADWDQLASAFATLAVRHAWLYGRSETSDEDYRVLGRVATDSVPPWITRVIISLAAGRGERAKVSTLLAAMRLPADLNPMAAPSAELRRLHQQGILDWNTKDISCALVAEHIPLLKHLGSGRAFTSAAMTA